MSSIAVNPNTSDAFLRTTGASFAAVRGAATGTVTSAAATSIQAQIDNDSFLCDRPLMCFDTSAIDDAATIDSATLTIYVTGGYARGGGDIYLELVTASPADPTSLASGDYDSFGTTRLAPQINVYPASGQTYTFTLNAAGLAAINKTGYTSFFVVMGNDFANSTTSPSDLTIGFPFSNRYTYAAFNSGDAGSNKPLLTVNYTLPSGGVPGIRRDVRLHPLYSFPD